MVCLDLYFGSLFVLMCCAIPAGYAIFPVRCPRFRCGWKDQRLFPLRRAVLLEGSFCVGDLRAACAYEGFHRRPSKTSDGITSSRIGWECGEGVKEIPSPQIIQPKPYLCS